MAAPGVTTYAVVPAAGAGSRMGQAEKKQYLALAGRPLIVHTLERLHRWPGLCGSVVVVPPADVDRVGGMLEGAGIRDVLAVVPGGAERHDSVRLGVEALCRVSGAGEGDIVFVHDGARPFPPVDRFDALLAAATPEGALLAVPCADTLKRGGESDRVAETVPRDGLWQAQTPQAFPLGVLQRALQRAVSDEVGGTDEAALVERLGLRPRLVPGSAQNLKVTRAEDLRAAAALLAFDRGGCCGEGGLHLGHGYDVHRLVEGRPLILGGVEIDHPRGLLGHSDADVLAHAVADACLGAAGRGDLGRWFPDDDPQWAGASSLHLLREISRGLGRDGFAVRRVDATLVAERPKVARHVPKMEARLSAALGAAPGAVSVKATTTEGMGFEGREEGISAHAVALLVRS